jgi:hypothetical protein
MSTNDPKYNFTQEGLIHAQDGYLVSPSEPVMVLRGKDVTSLAAITAYVRVLLEMEENTVVDSHLNSSLERLRTFYLYQQAGVGVGVGCSQLYHSGSAQIQAEALELLRELRLVPPAIE